MEKLKTRVGQYGKVLSKLSAGTNNVHDNKSVEKRINAEERTKFATRTTRAATQKYQSIATILSSSLASTPHPPQNYSPQNPLVSPFLGADGSLASIRSAQMMASIAPGRVRWTMYCCCGQNKDRTAARCQTSTVLYKFTPSHSSPPPQSLPTTCTLYLLATMTTTIDINSMIGFHRYQHSTPWSSSQSPPPPPANPVKYWS